MSTVQINLEKLLLQPCPGKRVVAFFCASKKIEGSINAHRAPYPEKNCALREEGIVFLPFFFTYGAIAGSKKASPMLDPCLMKNSTFVMDRHYTGGRVGDFSSFRIFTGKPCSTFLLRSSGLTCSDQKIVMPWVQLPRR